jgi:hypothetical protein
MLGHDNPHSHFSRALHDRVKVVYLEPQQYTVSVRLVITMADRAVIIAASALFSTYYGSMSCVHPC